MIAELLFFVLELVEGLLEVLVGLFELLFHCEIESFFEALIEGHFGDILHSLDIGLVSVDDVDLGEACDFVNGVEECAHLNYN